MILGTLLTLQSVLSLRDGYRFVRLVRRSWRERQANYLPSAAVIIPCKGLDQDFALNATRFLTQDYPEYQVIFVVASQQDPAHRYLAERLMTPVAPRSHGPRTTSLVVAERSETRGEKVNNLLRGLAVVDPQAEVLVFADADVRPGSQWLRFLVGPLEDKSVTVSTGFRWYLPGRSFASQLRAAWDTSIATMLGEHDQNFAWGGSMALRAADFERLKVADRYWASTVSDDYAVTRAVREARGKIRFEPRCLLASREDTTFRDFMRWANRQIIITRVYAAHLWGLGLASHGLYCGTFFLGLMLLAVPGLWPNSSAWWRIAIIVWLLLILVLGLAKARLRSVVTREIFPEENATCAAYTSRYWQLAPLVPWVMLINFVVAGITRRIEWRGTHYELRSAGQVRVLRRDDR